MGYLCPVCEEPFGDEAQCANHLAVTAILHGEAHEQWLADAVGDDWESVPRAELAALVADQATETTDHDHPGSHTHPVDQSVQDPEAGQPAITEPDGQGVLDADTQAILSEARELTERMQQRGPSDPADSSDAADSPDDRSASDDTDETKES